MQHCGKDFTSNLPVSLNLTSTDSPSKDQVCFVIPRNSPVRTLSRRSNTGSVSAPSGSGDGASLLSSGVLYCNRSEYEVKEKEVTKNSTCVVLMNTAAHSSLENCGVDNNSEHLHHAAESQRGPMNIMAGINHHLTHHQNGSMTNQTRQSEASVLMEELRASMDLIFQSKLTWLLLVGPVAIVGDSLGLLGEATCFALSGIALIPCAERLSWVTEQVALHTNQTIGALLNATFGNAPELLISVAALRSGFYRVVQLAMLGSMLTNMILIFGISCIIGGLRWQVQEVRLTSGNVSVGMLLVATAGSLFPAILILSGQFPEAEGPTATALDPTRNSASRDRPSQEEITLSRVNAAVMFILYLCYLVFQLGTHKDEFDDDDHEADDDIHHDRIRKRESTQRNLFCQKLCAHMASWFGDGNDPIHAEDRIATVPLPVPFRNLLAKRKVSGTAVYKTCASRSFEGDVENEDCERGDLDHPDHDEHDKEIAHELDENPAFLDMSDGQSRRRKAAGLLSGSSPTRNKTDSSPIAKRPMALSIKSKDSDTGLDGLYIGDNGHDLVEDCDVSHSHLHGRHQPLISLRVGIVWLFIITLCISAMSDILVETIDGFAARMQLSEVFTSMVVIPFFSNVAEQVSAFIFAYRNEMDLCVGVTIGSAIQIATFVLPGSVLIGMFMDRSMTLYFHSYETACLFFCTVLVAAVLQGGSTNWLVGAMLVGVYIMFAAGIWFHEIEILSIDEDSATDVVSMGSNETRHA